MSYKDTDIEKLFDSISGQAMPCDLPNDLKTDQGRAAVLQIEAENDFELFNLIIKWFNLLQSGDADNIYPDPFFKDRKYHKQVTEELADLLIKELDEDFQVETYRFSGKLAPDLNRLLPHSRLAFLQEYTVITLSYEEIFDSARKRIKKGEVFKELFKYKESFSPFSGYSYEYRSSNSVPDPETGQRIGEFD